MVAFFGSEAGGGARLPVRYINVSKLTNYPRVVGANLSIGIHNRAIGRSHIQRILFLVYCQYLGGAPCEN